MLSKKVFALLFLFLLNATFAQTNISLNGTVKSVKSNLPEAILDLKVNSYHKFAVSNQDGGYFFTKIEANIKDTLLLKVNCLGYQPFAKTFVIAQENMNFDIELVALNYENLKEVVVTSI